MTIQTILANKFVQAGLKALISATTVVIVAHFAGLGVLFLAVVAVNLSFQALEAYKNAKTTQTTTTSTTTTP